MSSENDLVVTADESEADAKENNTYNVASGGGGVENVLGVVKGIQNGDWDSAGLSLMGAGVDVVGLAADPLATLGSWAFGWAMEYFSFLREPFDALMGNPDAISGMASTWENIGKQLKAVSDEYGKSVQGTTGWEGKAGDAYRALGGETAKTVEALSAACDGMKDAVQGAGAVVGAVRGIVRDLIASAVGEIISIGLRWGAAAVCTAGIAAGGMVAEMVAKAISYANKIAGWMEKLADVLKGLSGFLNKLGSVGQSLKAKVDDFFTGLANVPEASVANTSAQKAFDSSTIHQIGEGAKGTGSSRFTDAVAGAKAGFGEYKPWAQGDLFKAPTVDMGHREGAHKFGYEVVKETAKLDDGETKAEQQQEKK
ncbi:hypothetical protein E1202_18420 [Saccharopolyspora karakumensis]|uniref:Outer membrane channel protein CpnT-like N-terminal domain-containing protein n=1 Tax=Saccharopolyspora karakumensis TaxID=2530386 RepID=A0A4R5BR90_9PSEU|nr:hypothetical protein [Saccharopolyspora karakumensis]TDD86602.1 hypothetical protein E1202_18420 [Saccharopolyspora karakumensis]